MSLLSFFKPLAYISLPVFLLRTASKASPLARYYVRLGIYLSTVGICSVWGVVASIGMSLIGKRYDIKWFVARSFYLLAGRLLDITIEVEGEEYLSQRPSVMLGNHLSMLDLLYLGRIFPKQATMTAKKELQWMPLLGQFMKLAGVIFIDRKNNARAKQSIAQAGERMKERKVSIWMFPEGTRSLSEKVDLRTFKKGAFHLAVQAGVPITPVVCENYYRLYHKGCFESGRIKIKVLPPIPTVGLTAADVTELSIRVRAQMLDALRELSGEVVEAPPADVKENVSDSSSEASSVPASLSIDTSTHLISSRASNSGFTTDDDDGMVLVDRPETPQDAP
ncbi:1-acylglycerol-3-phosphate O [Pyrrhoderma noxium]|uniref:1-acyl-sn-glycerol-3-phosphate acyltransferase n=1 Tax=Pyrrhoderma noxium TaxID=2282107 RepID=A0A286UN85_9AGAM|nr:1-acylglycerol-3-phosphate O [Pyrrhoderma noxium]